MAKVIVSEHGVKEIPNLTLVFEGRVEGVSCAGTDGLLIALDVGVTEVCGADNVIGTYKADGIARLRVPYYDGIKELQQRIEQSGKVHLALIVEPKKPKEEAGADHATGFDNVKVKKG